MSSIDQDSKLVEAVARAIWNAEPNVGMWCDWEELTADPEHLANLKLAETYRQRARAIIPIVLEQAAGVADAKASHARGNTMFPAFCLNAVADTADAIAQAIRSLASDVKEEGR